MDDKIWHTHHRSEPCQPTCGTSKAAHDAWRDAMSQDRWRFMRPVPPPPGRLRRLLNRLRRRPPKPIDPDRLFVITVVMAAPSLGLAVLVLVNNLPPPEQGLFYIALGVASHYLRLKTFAALAMLNILLLGATQ